MTIKANFPAIKPSLNLDFANSKVLDPRITFSRASTATYYDGKTTVKAEENLLTYSQDFDNATWMKGSLTISANTTVAPDGTTTAETMTDVAATSAHFVYKAVSTLVSVPYTASVYVKQGAASYVIVGLSGGNLGAHWAAATVNLGTGSITQTTNGSGVTGVSSSIVSVGSGWYRVTVTATSSAETAFGLMLEFSDTATPSIGNYCSYSYLGTGSNTAYIWGAQLEQRSTVTAYTQTTSVPITNYIPVLQTAAANVARFDHDPVTGESKGLLIEEQRTNLLTYSSDFDNGAWPKTNITLTPNATTAPDGTLTADLFAATTNTNAYYYRGVSLANGTYTYSIYVKKFGVDGTHNFYFNDATSSQATVTMTFTGGVLSLSSVLTTNVFSAGSATATNIGNGWYRVALTATITNGTGPAVALTCGNTGRDGYSGIYIWGAQLEARAFPTSYIPTTTAQVTRSADSASMTGTNFSSWFNASEGTVVGEFSSATNSTAQITGDVSGYGFEVGTSGGQAFHYNNSTNLFSANPVSVAVNVFRKVAAAGDGLSRSVCLNGGTVATSATPLLVNKPQNGLKIGSAASGGFANGPIKRITYYPKRLSNTELQSLTS